QPHLRERGLVEEQVLAARARLQDVDGREDAALLELPREVQLHVARALELLEDHVVHARAGLDQRGGEDRQRAAAPDVARRAEEALRPVQGVRVEAARERAPRRRRHEVVRAREPGDRVEEDHHVTVVLDDAPGALVHELGDADVVRGRLVERAGDDLDALDRLAEVGDLLGPLVDEQHDDLDVRLVRDDGVRDLLQQRGLPRLGRRDDEAALTAPDRRQQVDHAGGELVLRRLELDARVGEGRDQLLEARALRGLERVDVVDGLDPDQRAVALVVARAPGLAEDQVAGAQPELLDEAGGDDNAARVVLQQRLLEEAVAVGRDLEVAAHEPQALLLGGALEDRDDELVLLHLPVVLEAHLLGEEVQLGQHLRLELAEVQGALAALVAAAALLRVRLGLPLLLALLGPDAAVLAAALGRRFLGALVLVGHRRRCLGRCRGAVVAGRRLGGAVLGRPAPPLGRGRRRLLGGGLLGRRLLLAGTSPPAYRRLLARRGLGLAALGSWAHRHSVPVRVAYRCVSSLLIGPLPSHRHARSRAGWRGVRSRIVPGSKSLSRLAVHGTPNADRCWVGAFDPDLPGDAAAY